MMSDRYNPLYQKTAYLVAFLEFCVIIYQHNDAGFRFNKSSGVPYVDALSIK